MATAGSIVIDLLMKTGSFETDAKRAEARLKKFERESKQVGKALGTTIAAGAGIAAAGLGLVIKSTIEAEKAQAQLEAVLKSTKGAAGLAADEILAMSSDLQKLSTYGDEAITSAQSLLLTFTQIGREVFPEATQSVLDMSTALGKDLTSSAQMVGKALNDPVKGVSALAEAGIQFSSQQKEVIKTLAETGRVADAQRIILKELETQFGGSAKAARDTLGGAFQALQNAAGDLLEGDAGSLKGLKDGVNSLTGTLESQSTRTAFANMVSDIASVANAAANAITWLDKMRQVSQIGAGSIGLGDANNEALKERRRQLQLNIDAGKQWRQEEGNIFEQLAGGRDFSAYDAMVDEAKRIDALLNYKPSSPGNGRGRGVPVEIRPPATATGGKGGGGGKSEAEKEADALAQAYANINEQLDRQIALQGNASEMASLNYDLANGSLKNLSDTQKQELRDKQARVDLIALEQAAQERLTQETEKHNEAIRRANEQYEQLASDIMFEIAALGMSNRDLEINNALRYLSADATDEQRRAIADLTGSLHDQRKAMEDSINIQDEFRESFADNVKSVIDGSKSAKDAFLDFLDSVNDKILDTIANNWSEQLFGAKGQNGGGSQGGWLSAFAGLFGSSGGGGGGEGWTGTIASLFGSNSSFGGAFAAGGDVAGNKTYLVGEQGPEMFIPRTAGTIVPAGETARMMRGGGGVTQHIHNNFVGTVDRRSIDQVQQAQYRAGVRANRRNG